jgi:hypothetical protein
MFIWIRLVGENKAMPFRLWWCGLGYEMQYDMKNVFTSAVFCNTLIDVIFSAVVCPYTREDERILKFFSPTNALFIKHIRC